MNICSLPSILPIWPLPRQLMVMHNRKHMNSGLSKENSKVDSSTEGRQTVDWGEGRSHSSRNTSHCFGELQFYM